MQSLTEAQFRIVRHQGFYAVEGVLLPECSYGRDSLGTVEFTEHLLDGGRARTLGGWRDYRRETGWGPGSGPLQYALHGTLYEHRHEEGVKELRRIFRDDFRNHFMMTATGITYRAGAPDIVTHDLGTPEQKTLEARLAGSSGYVNNRMSEELLALLGDSDVAKVTGVYKWVMGKESYFGRRNNKPVKNEEEALVLGSYLGGLYINADDVIYIARPARGARVAPQTSTGSKG